MDPRVEEYLQACAERERLKEAAAAEALEKKDAEYRAQVLRKAGLVEEYFTECSGTEYMMADPSRQGTREKREDGWHYTLKDWVPIEVTDEEFAAIEKTVDLSAPAPEEIKDEKPLATGFRPVQPSQASEEESRSAGFFTGLAWILFIGGLIAAIILGFQQIPHITTDYYGRTRTNYTSEFSFSVFLTTYSSFFIGGMFCLAAAELFKKLQTIVNLLRRKQ